MLPPLVVLPYVISLLPFLLKTRPDALLPCLLCPVVSHCGLSIWHAALSLSVWCFSFYIYKYKLCVKIMAIYKRIYIYILIYIYIYPHNPNPIYKYINNNLQWAL